MPVIIRNLFLLPLVSMLAACVLFNSHQPAAVADGADVIKIKGALAYRERIALAPNSMAEITVSDISMADSKAPVIVAKTIALGRQQVPIDFELMLDKSRLQARHRYSLRATINGPDGDLQWTSDTAHIIDTKQAVNDMGTLLLVQTSANTDHVGSPLVGPEWVVEDVAGGGIIDASRATLNFGVDGKLSGRASCNYYSGEYETTGQSLSVGALAVTQRACVPALNKQEQRFLQILQNAQSYVINVNGKLIVHAASGDTLEAYPDR